MQETSFSEIKSKKILSISFYFFCCFISVLFSKETVCLLPSPALGLTFKIILLATATKEKVHICFAFCLWGEKIVTFQLLCAQLILQNWVVQCRSESESSWILAACTWEQYHLSHWAPQAPFGFNSSLTSEISSDLVLWKRDLISS